MEYSNVKGHKNLIRDNMTKAILNTNQKEYQNYISTRNQKNKESQRVQKIEHDVQSIRNDLDEIKQLLKELANGS